MGGAIGGGGLGLGVGFTGRYVPLRAVQQGGIDAAAARSNYTPRDMTAGRSFFPVAAVSTYVRGPPALFLSGKSRMHYLWSANRKPVGLTERHHLAGNDTGRGHVDWYKCLCRRPWS